MGQQAEGSSHLQEVAWQILMTKEALFVRSHLAPAQSSPRSETLADCTEPQESSSLRYDLMTQNQERQETVIWGRSSCSSDDENN